MKSVRLVQIFRPVKETNRTHSRGYVEDLSTQRGRKRCAKMAVLNLSVLPICAVSRMRGSRPPGYGRYAVTRNTACAQHECYLNTSHFPVQIARQQFPKIHSASGSPPRVDEKSVLIQKHHFMHVFLLCSLITEQNHDIIY